MCGDGGATPVEPFHVVKSFRRILDQLFKGEKRFFDRFHRVASVGNVAGKLVEIIARVVVQVEQVFNLCLQPATVLSFTRLLTLFLPARGSFLSGSCQYFERQKSF